ncbi:putative HTH-type transcriptional regulator [Phaeobacter piscinae]|uniref:HTH-type transcriptional regulator n=1 Tax=Phaeobacter piscinae TaxID=1580596 RepID=A0ABN5DG05_9RHOB|nr:AraC family transcriptional regulator [Phaeobacter piscinae]ATG35823.1 putative HTH-type transcriptional regulator [Phaeobacter piscinae]AUQ86344.1 putative HTH-type transcriptional regulator [Phaeobacter piscinae]AUR24227.1 putative HTH-type transcriptional regulator [Phaeobacter piscinae]
MRQSACLSVLIWIDYEKLRDANEDYDQTREMSYDHIFDQLDIQTEPFAVCEIHGTCHVALKPDAAVTLHYILCGQGQITMRGQAPIRLSKGSLVLIPSLNSHEVSNDGTTIVPGPSCKPAALNLAQVLKSAPDESVGSTSRLIALCAHVNIGLMGATDVVNLIREPLITRAEPGSELMTLVDTMMYEVCEPSVGSRALIRVLLMQALIVMMRKKISEQDGPLSWMAALRDPMLWQALNAMLENPGKPYSVETLADIAGMSRAAFAKRFAVAYGAGPMELLRSLRVRKAGDLLRNTNLPIKRVAETVGFSSRSAFSRAFEATSGHSPGAFRKEVR